MEFNTSQRIQSPRFWAYETRPKKSVSQEKKKLCISTTLCFHLHPSLSTRWVEWASMRGPGQSQSQTPAAHPTLVRQFSSLSHPSYPAHDPCPHCQLQSKCTRHACGGRPAPRQAWLVQRLQGARQTTDTQAYFPTYVGLKSLSTPNLCSEARSSLCRQEMPARTFLPHLLSL